MDTSYDLLVINGTVVTAADIGSYDIAVKDGKIALLAPKGGILRAFINTAKRVIDAEGGMVMVISSLSLA
jgi:dihydropyrimidinase